MLQSNLELWIHKEEPCSSDEEQRGSQRLKYVELINIHRNLRPLKRNKRGWPNNSPFDREECESLNKFASKVVRVSLAVKSHQTSNGPNPVAFTNRNLNTAHAML